MHACQLYVILMYVGNFFSKCIVQAQATVTLETRWQHVDMQDKSIKVSLSVVHCQNSDAKNNGRCFLEKTNYVVSPVSRHNYFINGNMSENQNFNTRLTLWKRNSIYDYSYCYEGKSNGIKSMQLLSEPKIRNECSKQKTYNKYRSEQW